MFWTSYFLAIDDQIQIIKCAWLETIVTFLIAEWLIERLTQSTQSRAIDWNLKCIANCYDFYVYRRVNGKLVLSVCVFATHRFIAPSSLEIPSFQVCSVGLEYSRDEKCQPDYVGRGILFCSGVCQVATQIRTDHPNTALGFVGSLCDLSWSGPAGRPDKFHPDYLRCGQWGQ